MATWSTVSAGEVLKADRLDADYYKPADLRTLRLVHNLGGQKLGDICSTILNGRTPPEYSACPHALDSFQHGIRWNRRHG